MISVLSFDVLLRPIGQALLALDYVRRPAEAKSRKTSDFEYLDAEWSNSKTGLKLFLSYGVDRRDEFRSLATFLFDRTNRSIDLEAAARQQDPALSDVFRVGHPDEPEEAFVERFAAAFASRVIPAVIDLLAGRSWQPDLPQPWDDYR
jgi:hypothetical protein